MSTQTRIEWAASNAAFSTPSDPPSESGTCKVGSDSLIPPSGAISQRTFMPLMPRRARYACHLRHTTSPDRSDSEVRRGGSIHSVGVVTLVFPIGIIGGFVLIGKWELNA